MPAAILSREEELHWIALTLVPGLGTRTSAKLIERFRSALLSSALRAPNWKETD
jgi:hypothetical protein